MIIVNGTIAIVNISDTSFADDGAPVAATRTEAEAIPCNISGSRRRENRSGDTTYTTADYEVLIDNMSDFYATEVVLYNNRGTRLGTFRVQDTQYLDCVDAVKIICNRYAD